MWLQQELEKEIKCAVKDFASSITSGRKIVADMSSLIEATSKLPLSNLEYWERLIRYEFSSQLHSQSKEKWQIWSQPALILTWIDLFSSDGYKREKTLRTLTGAVPNSFFFAVVIRRLNDWVPQVREAAREKIPLLVQSLSSDQVADVLFLTLSYWSSWGRMEQSDKQVLHDIISIKDISEALKSKIMLSTNGSLTSILAQICQTSVFDKYLSEIAKNAIQPSIRAKAYRSQLEGKMVWCEGRKWVWTDIRYCERRMMPILAERKITVTEPFKETLIMASKDKSSIVRRVAAEMLIRDLDSLGDVSLNLANQFASDASYSVAERGEFVLKKLGAKKL